VVVTQSVAAFAAVVIADQVDSRVDADRVPEALSALAHVGMLLPYERTAGDEIQGLAAAAEAVVESVIVLTRLEGWRVGVGIGALDEPLPDSTRAARGVAYLAARTAIGTARWSPVALSLVAGDSVRGGGYGEHVEDAETALWLLRSTLARRTREGWELMNLLNQGLTNAQAAERLGISPSAASQRLGRAARTEADRAALLATRLLDRLAVR